MVGGWDRLVSDIISDSRMTPQEQMAALRYYAGDKTKIAVFAYGSAMYLTSVATKESITKYLRSLARLGVGEGSAHGDITTMTMDDGNTVHRLGGGIWFVVKGHFTDRFELLRSGLNARVCRLQDATDPKIVEWFEP